MNPPAGVVESAPYALFMSSSSSARELPWTDGLAYRCSTCLTDRHGCSQLKASCSSDGAGRLFYLLAALIHQNRMPLLLLQALNLQERLGLSIYSDTRLVLLVRLFPFDSLMHSHNRTRTQIGPYDEIMFIPGFFKTAVRGENGSLTYDHSPRVTRIYVSTESSIYHGRKNWNIPKVSSNPT